MRKPKEGKAYQQIPEGHLPKEHWFDKTRVNAAMSDS